MNINKKIEEIRQKPEHIRMQYVIGCVAVSMIVLFGFWLFSVKNMLSGDSSSCTEKGTCEASSLTDFKNSLEPLEKSEANIKAKGEEGFKSLDELSKEKEEK